MKKKTLLTALVLGAITVPSVFAYDDIDGVNYNIKDPNIGTYVERQPDGTTTSKLVLRKELMGVEGIRLVADNDPASAFRDSGYIGGSSVIMKTVDKSTTDTMEYARMESGSVDLVRHENGQDVYTTRVSYGGFTNTNRENKKIDIMHGTINISDYSNDAHDHDITLGLEHGLYQGDMTERNGSRLTKDKLTISKANGEEEYDDYGNDITKKFTADYDLNGMTVANEYGNIKFTTSGINAGNQKIEGVAAGVADTDAVNVKQLKDSVTKAVADASPTVSGSGAVEVTSSTNSNGSTNYNVSLNTDGIREIAKTSNRYAGDKVVKVERWNNPTGSADLTTFKFDENEAAKVLPITYKANGEDAKTTTAANGFNFVDTDTVKASVEADGVVKFNVAKSVTDAIADNAKGVKDNAKAIDDLAKNTNDRLNDVVNGIDGLNGKVGENAKAIDGLKSDVVKAKTTVTAGNAVTVKETTNTNGSVNYEVSVDPKVTDQVKANTDAIGENTKGIQANADAIKELAKANNALAKEATDGLNGLNGRVDSLASKVDANQKEARRGIASASALAALHPLDYNPEHKVDVMAGVGHYRGNTAVALGAAYRPNENVMFTVGASINGKDSAINAGISYKVGTKDGVDYKYSKVAMQRHIDELNTTVAEQNEKIEQLNNLVEKLLEEVHQSK
jgi:hep/hag repeat protein